MQPLRGVTVAAYSMASSPILWYNKLTMIKVLCLGIPEFSFFQPLRVRNPLVGVNKHFCLNLDWWLNGKPLLNHQTTELQTDRGVILYLDVQPLSFSVPQPRPPNAIRLPLVGGGFVVWELNPGLS